MDNKYQVIALMGKSGAGKDTIAQETLRAHPDLFHPVVTCTTRPPRENEENGVDYYFLTPEEFLSKSVKGEFIEAKEFRGWFYGTPISSFDKNKVNLCIVTPSGARDLLAREELNVMVVYVICDARTRLMRALNRESKVDCNEICRRYFADEEDFANLDFDTYILDNNEKVDPASLDLLHDNNSLSHMIMNLHKAIG